MDKEIIEAEFMALAEAMADEGIDREDILTAIARTTVRLAHIRFIRGEPDRPALHIVRTDQE